MSHILQITLCTLAALNIYLFSNQETIVYSPAQMELHKKQAMKKMSTDPKNLKDKSYQMQRALKTVAGNDADYIPKVQHAGEIFTNASIPYQLMHNGVKIMLNSYYDVQWLTDVIYGLKGHHEPQEEKCFYEILKYIPEDGVMIELGSYWAYYSLWFATAIKNAHNYLIEPDPKRLMTGQHNFLLNEKTGSFTRGFVGQLKDNEPDINGTEWISMDNFIERNGIEHINILHADIQGAEALMLESVVEHLDKIDYFIISTHHPIEDHVPCRNFFIQHGLIIVAEHTALESCSGDGLIVAKRPGVAGPDKIAINTY